MPEEATTEYTQLSEPRKSYSRGQGLMQMELPDMLRRANKTSFREGGAGSGAWAPASLDLAFLWAAAVMGMASGG